jgi:hypothetical protein
MDDLAEHLRSWSHQPHETLVEGRFETTLGPLFFRLNVGRCLRAVPLSLSECLARGLIGELVPESEIDISMEVGILKLCLLGCKPFVGLSSPEILDVRKGVPRNRRTYRCQNWAGLFKGLAWALFAYDRALYAEGWSDFSDELRQTVAGLERSAALLDQLHQHGRTLVHQSLIRPRSIPALLRDVRRVRMNLTLIQEVDYRHAFGGVPQAWALAQYLVQDMVEAFKDDGPSEFPKAAMYAALAAILKPLGVCNQRGKPVTAAGIKGMRRRQHGG